jgi:hypothetical protein
MSRAPVVIRQPWGKSHYRRLHYMNTMGRSRGDDLVEAGVVASMCGFLRNTTERLATNYGQMITMEPSKSLPTCRQCLHVAVKYPNLVMTAELEVAS